MQVFLKIKIGEIVFVNILSIYARYRQTYPQCVGQAIHMSLDKKNHSAIIALWVIELRNDSFSKIVTNVLQLIRRKAGFLVMEKQLQKSHISSFS